MKRVKMAIAIVLTCIIIFFVGKFLWNAILSDILPWSQTEFENYEEYIDLVSDNRCFAWFIFAEDIPLGSKETTYYWYRQWSAKHTAYSTVLPEEEYNKVVNERVNFYNQEWADANRVQMYLLKDNTRYYVKDSEWFKENFGFVKRVMQNPETQQGYYYLTAIQIDTADGYVYSGVALNDSTREMIEFCYEFADPKPES